MDDLLADFVAETREMLEAVGGEIVAWEADPADRARLDVIFRFVHTVKGNCGFFDFPRLAALSHAAEDALSECRAGRRDPDHAFVSAILNIIDRIGEMTTAIGDGHDYPEGGDDDLVAALQTEAVAAGIEPVTNYGGQNDSDGLDQSDQPSAQKGSLQRTIRLPVTLLDEVMKGVSDMVLARNDLARRLREAGDQPAIDGPFERLSSILADVRAGITRMRMQRLDYLFGSLPRLVRAVSDELGKQVMVDFEGGDVELDREMIEMVRDPLTHIIRNAIDHGIETPGERRKSGKREIGLLRFAARQSGNRISLVISDDGKGIDGDHLAAKAVAAGLYDTADVTRMSERQKLMLMFEPGLSTAAAVSSISGRGVGMDVVRSNIEKVGGSIDVTSRPDEGTSIHLQLPLTLSIIAALTVEVAGELYAIPRSYVEEVAFANVQSVEFASAGERQLVTFRDRRVPCLALADVLQTSDDRRPSWSSMTLVLVRLASDEVFALGVDRVHDHEDVVVKPIPPAIMQTGLYGGTTLLDDGRPIMLLDIPSIAASQNLVGETHTAAGPTDDDAGQNGEASPIMLFRGLDMRKRALRLELVRRIDTVESEAVDIDGARAQVVVDGRILPLAGWEGGPIPEGRCQLFRLSDGESDLSYIVAEVMDTTFISEAVVGVPDDPAIEGVTLIEGQLVPIIDGFALFANQTFDTLSTRQPICRLPGDSEWSRTILEPLVRAAGYAIASENDSEADIAIQIAGADGKTPGPARSTIRLTSDPRDVAGGAIYRYDRSGLLGALRQASRETA